MEVAQEVWKLAAVLVEICGLREMLPNCALHAPDVKPLELEELARITIANQSNVSFRSHPSVGLIRAEYPADHIWRAVLAGDDRALATLDLAAGPVFLLVERNEGDLEVTRLQEAAWSFLNALCRGEPLAFAMDWASGLDAAKVLAEHLAGGRFVAFATRRRNLRRA